MYVSKLQLYKHVIYIHIHVFICYIYMYIYICLTNLNLQRGCFSAKHQGLLDCNEKAYAVAIMAIRAMRLANNAARRNATRALLRIQPLNCKQPLVLSARMPSMGGNVEGAWD
jgi:hypothetical protein